MNTPSRTIRVFLSSTFRDFAEERDLLVRQIFPELRRRCRERRSARRACREADGCRALAKPAPQVARPSGG